MGLDSRFRGNDNADKAKFFCYNIIMIKNSNKTLGLIFITIGLIALVFVYPAILIAYLIIGGLILLLKD